MITLPYNVELFSGLTIKDESQLQSLNKINQEYESQLSQCLDTVRDDDDDDDMLHSCYMSYTTAFLRTDYIYDISKFVEDYCCIGLQYYIRTIHFILYILYSDAMSGCRPVSMVVSDTCLYFMAEHYHLPFSRGRSLAKRSYFIFLSRLLLSDIAHLVSRS